jgi:hypothetical protein
MRLTYSRQENRMLLIIPHGTTVTLTRDAADVIGFIGTGPFKCTGSGELRMWGPRSPNFQRKLNTLQVHCDLVSPHPVGDDIVSLLRLIPAASETNKFITKTYRDVHYYPVARNTIASVRIYIRDADGGVVPFERGRVVVTLHLRRVRP